MNQRAQKLQNRLLINTYPIYAEKPALVIESYRQTKGEPQVVSICNLTIVDRETLRNAQERPEQR